MSILTYIIIFSFIGSVVSLVGGAMLLYKKDVANNISRIFTPFAAGTLLGTAFFDLLPEAHGESNGYNIFVFTVAGFLIFFFLERFIHWLHSQRESTVLTKPVVPLVIFGDTLHNFIDGVAIAITFLVSIPLGIVTSLAVAAHEIPQEIGDFGILLKKGLSRKQVLKINFYSALVAMAGAIGTYFFGEALKGLLPVFLSLTAGFFIYISATNLIPEIHEENQGNFALFESILLMSGILIVYFSIQLLEH